MLRTSLRAEASDGSLSGELFATPLANLLNSNVAMHYPYSIDSVLLELLLYKGRSHF